MKTLLLILALTLTGCSAFENMMTDKQSSLQLLCESETPTACEGFLTDKPIDEGE